MNVTGLSGDSSVLNIWALYGTQATDPASSLGTTQTIAPSQSTTSTDSASFSSLSEFLSKLQQLKSSDPDKFKQICTDIANKLQSAAQQLGDKPGAKMLSDLASKFENVANGGDISQLQPPTAQSSANVAQSGIQQYSQQDSSSQANAMGASPHHHHHHHGGGGNSGIGQLMSSIFAEVDQATSGTTPAASVTN